jgi:hypothetical protein
MSSLSRAAMFSFVAHLAATLVRNSTEQLIMIEPSANKAFPDVSKEERNAIELARHIVELREAGMHGDAQRLRSELDAICRRDPVDAMFSHRIRRHTLIEDNPCSG